MPVFSASGKERERGEKVKETLFLQALLVREHLSSRKDLENCRHVMIATIMSNRRSSVATVHVRMAENMRM